jgi:gliding motility-associated-like protein
MKRIFTLFFILLIFNLTKAQNLVPNPSFELNSGCPTSIDQISKLDAWFKPPNHQGSPDYFNACSPSIVSVPDNFAGSEIPATGNAYVGLCLFGSNFREYIEVKLNTPMVSGNTYSVSFDYSSADESNFSSDAFGIHFSSTLIKGNNDFTPIKVSTQLMPIILNKKDGWASITLNYTAIGGEEYMILGNFLDDINTNASYLGNFGFNGTYLYLDNFSITENILEIPNLFTPNNDNYNDLFTPIISKGIESMHTIIYNRWGDKVFDTNNLMIEWNGLDAPDGVYYWVIFDIHGINKPIKGYVTIIR